MTSNARWRVLGLPLTFFGLIAAIDCSSSSSGIGCPTQLTDLDLNGSCAAEQLTCPYADGTFDTFRSDTASDCFSGTTGFIEYTCTQKKWTLTAQSATACTFSDSSGTLSSTSCLPGVGRCVAAAGTSACATSCYAGVVNGYAASCVSGQFVVTSTPCNTSAQDAGDQPDASTVDDASADNDGAADSGDD